MNKIGLVSSYDLPDAASDADYIFRFLYVHMETSTQFTWTRLPIDSTNLNADRPARSENTDQRRFVFLHIIHHIPQKEDLLHSITVQMVSKMIEDDITDGRVQHIEVVKAHTHALHDSKSIFTTTVVFALQVASVGVGMEAQQNVMVGVCDGGYSKTLLILVFDLVQNAVYEISLADGSANDDKGLCADMGSGSNSAMIHAHLDPVLRMLYVFRSSFVYSVKLDDTIKHSLQDAYTAQKAMTVSKLDKNDNIVAIESMTQLPFVKTTLQATLQANTLHRFCVLSKNWLYIAGLKYAFSLVTGTIEGVSHDTVPDINLFQPTLVAALLRKQLVDRHARGIDTSHNDMATLTPDAFSIVHDKTAVTWPDAYGSASMPPEKVQTFHVLLSFRQKNLFDTAQILCLVCFCIITYTLSNACVRSTPTYTTLPLRTPPPTSPIRVCGGPPTDLALSTPPPPPPPPP